MKAAGEEATLRKEWKIVQLIRVRDVKIANSETRVDDMLIAKAEEKTFFFINNDVLFMGLRMLSNISRRREARKDEKLCVASIDKFMIPYFI